MLIQINIIMQVKFEKFICYSSTLDPFHYYNLGQTYLQQNLKTRYFKMSYFCIIWKVMKCIFWVARLKSFTIHYSSPSLNIQFWLVLGDEKHNFRFQYCQAGVGDDFIIRCKFCEMSICCKRHIDCLEHKPLTHDKEYNVYWQIINMPLLSFCHWRGSMHLAGLCSKHSIC